MTTPDPRWEAVRDDLPWQGEDDFTNASPAAAALASLQADYEAMGRVLQVGVIAAGGPVAVEVIQEQQDRLAALQADYERLEDQVGRNGSDAAFRAGVTHADNLLLAENKAMEAALQFYADNPNYGKLGYYELSSLVVLDHGKKARAALHRTKGEG